MRYFRSIPALAGLALASLAPASELGALVADCDACHGPNGVSVHGDVPIIGGKEHVLLERALRQFRDMTRPCKRSAYRHGNTSRPHTSMCRITQDLADGQIESVSEHYATLPFVPARQEFDADLAVEGAALHSLYCESCHPKGGSEAGYADRLAGQWTPYLRRTIGQISESELAAPHMMERKLGDFSEREIESLLNFWASQQGD